MIRGKRNRDLPLCFPSVFECNGPLAQPAGDCCIDRVGAVIKAKGYKPVRVMFYYPQREQAVKIQETLRKRRSEPAIRLRSPLNCWNELYGSARIRGIVCWTPSAEAVPRWWRQSCWEEIMSESTVIPARSGCAANAWNAVSYTHLTLPTT